MSLDIDLHCDHCHTTIADFNITHNLAPMWCEATGEDWFRTFQGKKAGEMLPLLKQAAATLAADPVRFKKLDPPNGWGSYEGLVGFVGRLIEASERSPEARWSGCR